MIDDTTNEVFYAGFFPSDTVFANMHVIRRFIEIKGIFMSLYVDKASHFKTTRHGGLLLQKQKLMSVYWKTTESLSYMKGILLLSLFCPKIIKRFREKGI